VVLLAVKPQAFSSLAGQLAAILAKPVTVISVMAGVPGALIKKKLGDAVRVIRAMPNTPALLGEGMTALSRGPGAGAGDIRLALDVFGTVGATLEVAEQQMDLVTGLSGSGPAYFFLLVEALAAAGVKQGLNKKQAGQLAAQTALGAARMLVESGASPASLRQKVTSKGGTTEAALKVLARGKFNKLINDTVLAAVRRGKELGKEIR
jgi:pyrroline-5-carboxylate reductase